ncbi:DUF4199 domain-containing protein [Aquimarina sp. Aq78]|uniref:DUF4199 domain-containing protein n=1 Tax=Aquimarina sp. Aq78 TaxID=1191889 RepID=UPI000D0FE873|nr:DUF4199 domain-containing protein [Aquimarina sp. Aq78]
METNAISTKKYITKYGIISGIAWITLSIILYITDNTFNHSSIYTLAELLIHSIPLIYGIYAYKSKNNGFLKLKKALKIGMGISLIGGITYIIWDTFLKNVIEPELMNQRFNASRERIFLKDPNISPEEVHKTMEFSEIVVSPYIYIPTILILHLSLGFIISLITGAILHKKQNL